MTTTEIPSYDTGSRVEFNGQTTTVAYVIYNSKTCTLCRTVTCRRLQLESGVTVRECEVRPAQAAMVEGQTISKVYDYAEVVLKCVRPGYAYRVSVFSGAAEVDALTRSYPTEAEARTAARGACKLFARGATVQLVLDALEYATTVTNQIAA